MTDDRTLMKRLRRIDNSSLSDADKTLRVLSPALRPMTAGVRMVGRAVTASAQADLMSVLAGLEQAGAGDVLVVADCGDEYAVTGELFATEATRRGLAGIVLDGMCRDLRTVAQLSMPIYARGSTPRAAPARAVPVAQVKVLIGEVEVHPGDLVLADEDGIIVATERQLEAAIDAAEAIQQRDEGLRTSIEGGRSLFDQVNFSDHAARLAAGDTDSALSFS